MKHFLVLVSLMVTGGFISCSKIFDDPIEELDPNQVILTELESEDSTEVPVKPLIIRKSILESFGNFGCVSCPEAEEILARYVHGKQGIVKDTNLIIVNYHTEFSSPLRDPWESDKVQLTADLYGYGSALPQVKLNGNNSQYGFNEINVLVKSEYHSLLASRHGVVDTSDINLVINPDSVFYVDTNIVFKLRVENWSENSLDNVSLKILAVKNQPVFAPYPGMQEIPWEFIVVDVLTTDQSGNPLVIPELAGLSSGVFNISFGLGDESEKHLTPPMAPYYIETMQDYALIVLISNAQGIILNVLAYQYHPVE